jgi:hypothetical protein
MVPESTTSADPVVHKKKTKIVDQILFSVEGKAYRYYRKYAVLLMGWLVSS